MSYNDKSNDTGTAGDDEHVTTNPLPDGAAKIPEEKEELPLPEAEPQHKDDNSEKNMDEKATLRNEADPTDELDTEMGKAKAPAPFRIGLEAVNIADIKVDKVLYPRHEIIEENVERLCGIGPNFKDPIIVSKDRILVDGQHRLKALQLDGITQVEVEVYEYPSNEALLRHAVELNSRHGHQLSHDDKKAWVRKVWALKTPAENLAMVVGVSIRTIHSWTSDLNMKAKQERDDDIFKAVDRGMTHAEAARACSVDPAMVTRALQKRLAAKMQAPPVEHVSEPEESVPIANEDVEAHSPDEEVKEDVAGEDADAEVLRLLEDALEKVVEAGGIYRDLTDPAVSKDLLRDTLENLQACLSIFGTRE